MVKITHQSVDSDLKIYGNIKAGLDDVTSQLNESVKQHADYVKAKYENVPFKRIHYSLYDSFTRANSNIDLDKCETNNSVYTYASASTSVWGVENGKAKPVSIITPARSIAHQQGMEHDCIVESNVTLTPTSLTNGLAFRIGDVNNFLYVCIKSDSVVLGKVEASADTTIGSYSKAFNGDCKLTVLLKGKRIRVYVDGFLLIDTLSSFNLTNTLHGLYSKMDDDLSFRWNDFCVKPSGEIYFDFKEDFENGIDKWYWTKESPNMLYSQTFSTTIKESGTKSFRIELHNDDPDVSSSKRCEIMLPSENPLEEHWYGVSTYLPKGGDEDYTYDISDEILIQWHTTPDSGEVNISPPLALRTGGGNYKIFSLYDAGRMSIQSPPTYTLTTKDLGSYEADKGKWVQWAFHVKWGWLASQNPILEVYKDGQLVLDLNGTPNCTNDAKGIYPKLGIYKWNWKDNNPTSLLTKRVVYYDNFWIK